MSALGLWPSPESSSRGIYMRPERTQTGMSSDRSPYISFPAFTWDRSKNDIQTGRSLTQDELLSYRCETVPLSFKRKRISGGNYMRPGRTRTGMSSYRSPYISFHTFTWDRPKNELRAVWLCVGRWPDTSYFRTGPRLYRSHVKRKRIQDRVHK